KALPHRAAGPIRDAETEIEPARGQVTERAFERVSPIVGDPAVIEHREARIEPETIEIIADRAVVVRERVAAEDVPGSAPALRPQIHTEILAIRPLVGVGADQRARGAVDIPDDRGARWIPDAIDLLIDPQIRVVAVGGVDAEH